MPFRTERNRMLDDLRAAEFEVVRVLKDDFFAENLLLARGGERFVAKHSRMRQPLAWVLRPVSWLLSRLESRAYDRMRGVTGVPGRVEPSGRAFFVHRYVEGTTLHRYNKEHRDRRRRGEAIVSDAFFAGLETILVEIHRRGMTYNDLSKPENIIVGADGRPYLIDFQISSDFSALGPALRKFLDPLFGLLRREDLYHLLKLKAKIRPDLVTSAERARLSPSVANRAHRLLRVPLLGFKRLVFPKGSDDVWRWKL